MQAHRPTTLGLVLMTLLLPSFAHSAEVGTIRAGADRSFQLLDQAIRNSPALHQLTSASGTHSADYAPERYVIGHGQGDMTKGRLACQRVAELAARAELAKQIRVLIKEHAVDRTRERSGHPVEQDLEITREEIVQESLRGVQIVDRHVDEPAGLCSCTAVMPRESLLVSTSDTTAAAAPAHDPSPAARPLR